MEKTGAKRSTLQRALEGLERERRIAKHNGAGKTGRGNGYTLAGQGNDVPIIDNGLGHSPFPHVF